MGISTVAQQCKYFSKIECSSVHVQWSMNFSSHTRKILSPHVAANILKLKSIVLRIIGVGRCQDLSFVDYSNYNYSFSLAYSVFSIQFLESTFFFFSFLS